MGTHGVPSWQVRGSSELLENKLLTLLMAIEVAPPSIIMTTVETQLEVLTKTTEFCSRLGCC